MKKIWTLLVAAITVLAVLTSGCGSSDKAAKPADGKNNYHRLLHLHTQQPLLRIRT